MTALLKPNANLIAASDSKRLALIRRTVAKDCNDDEFNMFISMSRSLNLDPLRKQIYAFVFSKDKPDKRRMSIVVGIDGFRTIADRTGCYRPDEDEPTYEIDPSKADPATNPVGLVKATVRVWKWSRGEWHKVTVSAFWDEYAPIKDVWGEDKSTGRRGKTGKQELDTSGNWPKMPRHMLAKVAEALALRKAWPDDFSNVYVEEELARARMIDITPSEQIEAAEVQERIARIGGPGITIDWLNGQPLLAVPAGQLADRALSWIDENRHSPETVKLWADRNRHPLREFWATSKVDALAIKEAVDGVVGR